MCVSSEGLDTTGIDNASPSMVNSRCGGEAMAWNRQSGKHFRFRRPIRQCSHARLLLLLGITHLELDGGPQRVSKAMRKVEE